MDKMLIYFLILPIFIAMGIFTVMWLEDNYFSIEREKVMQEGCVKYPTNCDNVIYELPQFITPVIIFGFVALGLFSGMLLKLVIQNGVD